MFLSSNLSTIFLLPYSGHLQHIKSFYRYQFICFASRALKSMILEFYSFYDNLFANILSLSDHVFVSFFYRYMHTNTGATMVGNLMKLNIIQVSMLVTFGFLYMYVCIVISFSVHVSPSDTEGKARQGKSFQRHQARQVFYIQVIYNHIQSFYRYRFNWLASTVLKETILGFYRFCYILFVSFLYLTDIVLQDFSTNTSTYLEIPNTDMFCR